MKDAKLGWEGPAQGQEQSRRKGRAGQNLAEKEEIRIRIPAGDRDQGEGRCRAGAEREQGNRGSRVGAG